MRALQQCFAICKHSVRYSSHSATSSGFRSWLLSKAQASRRSTVALARFQVDRSIVDAQDLFRYSDKKHQGSTLPSKERLEEVEKIIACVLFFLTAFSCIVSHHRGYEPACSRTSQWQQYTPVARLRMSW